MSAPISAEQLNSHRRTTRLTKQPAEGWYSDCSCGRFTGELRITKEQAIADFETHLLAEKEHRKKIGGRYNYA